MSIASLTAVLPLATEGEGGGAGAIPFIIGGGVFLLLIAALLVLLAIGKGREHS